MGFLIPLPVPSGGGPALRAGDNTARAGDCAISSQHTRWRRPQVRHSYWPWAGHMGAVCINLHQRSAIVAWVGFIDLHSF